MKKMSIGFLLGIFIIVLSASAALAIKAPTSEITAGLLEERQIDCWVEGEVFGDLVIGSRGSIQFIYLDAKLSRAISEEHSLAPWVDDFNQYFGTPETANKALFIAQLEANKPWDVKAEYIRVGDYNLNKDDIISPSWKNPFGSIDPGDKWQFAFVVPMSELKKGEEIMVGYGDDLVKWRVPK
ncbi:MAG: hypothetical protein LLF78_05165 [Synergistaceae bacterium]|nr:hypothetical protein [Synergistaceae bacterium]